MQQTMKSALTTTEGKEFDHAELYKLYNVPNMEAYMISYHQRKQCALVHEYAQVRNYSNSTIFNNEG